MLRKSPDIRLILVVLIIAALLEDTRKHRSASTGTTKWMPIACKEILQSHFLHDARIVTLSISVWPEVSEFFTGAPRTRN